MKTEINAGAESGGGVAVQRVVRMIEFIRAKLVNAESSLSAREEMAENGVKTHRDHWRRIDQQNAPDQRPGAKT